jgi:CRP-like cAMP-binding protein
LSDLGDDLVTADEPDTLTSWPPTGGPGSAKRTQPWPTVLEERSLLFLGQRADVPDAPVLERLGDPRQLVAGETLFDEGASCDLLYQLEQGALQVSRTGAGLGIIAAGSVFGDLGALSQLPASARVAAIEPCSLRAVTRRKLQVAMRHEDVTGAIHALKRLYIAAVLSLSLPFARCTPEQQSELASIWQITSTRAGEAAVTTNCSGPFRVIVTGLAEVTLGEGEPVQSLGVLGPSDLIGELDPSPVTVTARSDLCAITFDRGILGQLPPSARQALQAHVAQCHRALSAARGAVSES